MASLYQINEQIENCVDLETGEIIDLEALESLLMERRTKLENIALWIKNLAADADAYKAEKEAFADREKKARKKIESLKSYLTSALAGQSFNTDRCAVSFRKSTKTIIDDFDLIPLDFVNIKTEYTANKTEILKAIKNGQTVDGCHIEETQNISIK